MTQEQQIVSQELDSIALILLNTIQPDIGPAQEIDIIHSAMTFLKNNPQSTIQEACTYGLHQWIK